ncbi:Probable ribosome biogenesis protein TcasGA2_TC003119, related [Eimeria praecox]|uniref:Probable ribosome biogenesis protein TcasGA2_TC003119, related n=1 Tax=Eimeria praecox TaxID=51316 RepID=U6H5W8_9EIME|nr:Probable ribosome biogenesis protein TcasGA2_TC003119, related [Eimeria praecox]
MADAPAARASRKKKGGDPERRKQCSIHELMKRVSLKNKPTASSTDLTTAAGVSTAEQAAAPAAAPAAALADAIMDKTGSAEGRLHTDATCSSETKEAAGGSGAGAAAAAAATTAAATEGTGSRASSIPKESPDELSLFMFDFGECDAQRCSGRRLLRHRKLNKVMASGQVEYSQALGGRRLSGSSSRSSSTSSNRNSICRGNEGRSDSESGSEAEQDSTAASSTAAATETTEANSRRNKGSLVRGYPSDPILYRQDPENERVLPLLLCGNPTHYGAPNILNCAEALAGALYIAGYRRHAELVLSSFTWGPHFLDLNKRFLDRYVSVPSGAEMKALKLQQDAELLKEKTNRDSEKANNTKGYSSIYAEIETVLAAGGDPGGE